MIIKREQVIKALRTEPLKNGQWIQVKNSLWTAKDITDKPGKKVKNCKVCAVGAVLRHNTKLSPNEIDSFGDELIFSTPWNISDSATDEDVNELLNEKNYLSALSAYFESTLPAKGIYGKKHRERLVQWVKENFPKQIKVKI